MYKHTGSCLSYLMDSRAHEAFVWGRGVIAGMFSLIQVTELFEASKSVS